jgi:hypothetical protein
MTPQLPSAIDCVNPAVERAKWLLLKPFRWAVWWRMAIIALAVSGGAAGNLLRIPDLVNATRRRKEEADFLQATPFGGITQTPHFWAMAALIAFLLVLLVFVHLYVSSVLRFVLFDAVSTGQYRLRAGWKKWHGRGAKLFVIQLAIAAVYLLLLGIFVGLPFLYAFKTHWFDTLKDQPLRVLALVVIAIPAVLVVALISYVVFSVLFDFTIPILALEEVGPGEALSRAWNMFRARLGQYAGYLGMKFVVSLAIALCVGIVQAILFVVILIPTVIVIAGITVASPNIWTNPVALAAMITIAIIGTLVLMFVAGLFQVPVVTFIQSYAVTFFAARYAPLWTLLYPNVPHPEAAVVQP